MSCIYSADICMSIDCLGMLGDGIQDQIIYTWLDIQNPNNIVWIRMAH